MKTVREAPLAALGIAFMIGAKQVPVRDRRGRAHERDVHIAARRAPRSGFLRPNLARFDKRAWRPGFSFLKKGGTQFSEGNKAGFVQPAKSWSGSAETAGGREDG